MPKSSPLDDTDERGDLALRQRVALPSSHRTHQVFQAVRSAVHLSAGYLDGPQVLDNTDHGVEVVPRRGLRAAGVLALLEREPSVTECGHKPNCTPTVWPGSQPVRAKLL